tara:strand:- start:24 stop:1073 length:1050 start_codon:yes stop_codon:yes gene_type:complete
MLDLITNNIFPFILILTILVFVHELGHYLVARRNGVKVEVFSVGFGKEIFGYTDKSGTRWKFSLIPLGGYVKMHGDLDEASSKKDKSEKINAKESFHEKSIAQRSMILFAGPAANFLFSFLLLVFINSYFGISIDKPVISMVENNKSAFKAGLKEGDIILEIDGNEIEKFSELRKFIQKKNNDYINVLYSRNGNIDEIKILVEENKIGIRGTIETRKLNFLQSCYESLTQIIYFTKATLVGVYEIFSGTRGTDELGGPIRIAELSGDFWSKGLHSTLWFMMIISLNLGLINLFPIPMLDGGHLLLNFVEFLNGKPLKQKYLEAAHTFGFIILISLMVFATYNDISRFFE